MAGAGWMVAVVAWTIAVLGQGPVLGVEPREVATVLAFLAASLMLTGWAVERSRGGWRDVLGSVLIWAVLATGLGATYVNRGLILETARGLGDEFGVGSPQASVGQGGEVTVIRRVDGAFAVPARLNEHDTTFLFDTGASTVVLSAETARLLFMKPETLRFRVPVTTANGRNLAAPVTIDRFAVGSIVLRRVPALVARDGMLEGNLLGQTFLDKLESYEVRGNRLVLRAAKS